MNNIATLSQYLPDCEYSPFIISLLSSLNLIIPFIVRNRAVRLCLMLLVSCIHIINAYYIYHNCIHDNMYYTTICSISLFDFSLSVNAQCSVVFLLIAILWPISIIYTQGFLSTTSYTSDQPQFLFLTNLSIIISSYTVCAANFFTLLICYECLTFATIPLVSYTSSPRTEKVMRKYMLALYLPSLLLLVPIFIILQNHYHTTNFIQIADLAPIIPLSKTCVIIVALCAIYGTAKAAVVPCHVWLPPAMIAPYPVSAILHAVAVVNIGVFSSLTIILHTTKSYEWLLDYLQYIIIISIIYSSIKALLHTNIKKIFAYSTIANLGIMILSGLMHGTHSFDIAMQHMIAHSISKMTLFYGVGCLYTIYQCIDIYDLKSIGYKDPILAACLVVGIASLIGLPFTAGFFSKHHIMQEAVKEQNYLVLFTMIFTSIMACCYLGKILTIMYNSSTQPDNDSKKVHINIAEKNIGVLPLQMLLGTIFCTSLIILYPIVTTILSH